MSKSMERMGFWIETAVNIMITLVLLVLPPWLVWREGVHWGIIILSAFVSSIAAAFASERFIVKLSWAEWLFPGCREHTARPYGITIKEFTQSRSHKRAPAEPPVQQGTRKTSDRSVSQKAEKAPGTGIFSRLRGHGWRVGLFLFGLVFIGGGAMAFIILVKNLANHNWPSTKGIITQSDIRLDDGGYAPDFYAPDMRYNYSVQGKTYTGSFISIGKFDNYFTEKGALRRIAEYPEGMAVNVYYDPGDPAWVVLEKGVGFFTLILPVAGILLLGFGAIAIKGALTEKSPSAERAEYTP